VFVDEMAVIFVSSVEEVIRGSKK